MTAIVAVRLLPYAVFCAVAFGLGGYAQAADVMKSPSECELHRQLSNEVPPECVEPAAPSGIKYRSIVLTPNAGMAAPPSAVAAEPVSTGPKSANMMISFEYKSARLTSGAKGDLDRVAAVLSHGVNGGSNFQVIGHTDAAGGEAYNLQLSRERAESVVSYLEQRGVDGTRLRAEGKGKAELIDPDHPSSAANRRVEIINLGK